MEETKPPQETEVSEEESAINNLLAGKDLEGKSLEEVIEVIINEREDSMKLLSKFGMALMLNSGLYGAAQHLIDARVPHPKHDEKSKTFLVYKEEFIDLVNYLHGADTDFQELIVGELHIKMNDVIEGYKYIMEQRKISGIEIAKNLSAERDALYHKVNFLLVQVVKAARVQDKTGFDLMMAEATKFVTEMEQAQKGQSGTEVAKENITKEKEDAEKANTSDETPQPTAPEGPSSESTEEGELHEPGDH